MQAISRVGLGPPCYRTSTCSLTRDDAIDATRPIEDRNALTPSSGDFQRDVLAVRQIA